MDFVLKWTKRANAEYVDLREAARIALAARERHGKKKSSEAEGLFKQVLKTLSLLACNPKHPGLKTHEFDSLPHPYTKDDKVWEAYIQNKTPGAYQLFWCYGPKQGEMTIIAITPHP